jgi:hypothetical protein
LDFVHELRERAVQLGGNPLAFPLVPRHEHSGRRRRVFRDNLIFYQVRCGRMPLDSKRGPIIGSMGRKLHLANALRQADSGNALLHLNPARLMR